MELGRQPLLRDVGVTGGRATRIWQGQLNAAGVGIEIAEIALDQNATPARMRQAWTGRRAGQARPVDGSRGMILRREGGCTAPTSWTGAGPGTRACSPGWRNQVLGVLARRDYTALHE